MRRRANRQAGIECRVIRGETTWAKVDVVGKCEGGCGGRWVGECPEEWTADEWGKHVLTITCALLCDDCWGNIDQGRFVFWGKSLSLQAKR